MVADRFGLNGVLQGIRLEIAVAAEHGFPNWPVHNEVVGVELPKFTQLHLFVGWDLLKADGNSIGMRFLFIFGFSLVRTVPSYVVVRFLERDKVQATPATKQSFKRDVITMLFFKMFNGLGVSVMAGPSSS